VSYGFLFPFKYEFWKNEVFYTDDKLGASSCDVVSNEVKVNVAVNEAEVNPESDVYKGEKKMSLEALGEK